MMNYRSRAAVALEELQNQIMKSKACPRLVQYCRRVAQQKRAMHVDEQYWGKAVPSFGDPRAQLVIIGLAPAAHGGNRTGRMFTGDRSGDFLVHALYEAGFANQPHSTHRNDGLILKDCYITSAVRWAPPQNKPTPAEIRQCLPFLQRELELLPRARAVLVLGKLAFDAYIRLARQRTQLPPIASMPFRHGAVYELPAPLPRLFCSYHPSQHNTQTGRLTHSMFLAVLGEIRRYLTAEGAGSKEEEDRRKG